MTAPSAISAAALRAALAVAERWLAANRDGVNAINVYPVPDGDTGTNMLLTWRAALQAAADTPEDGAGPYLAAFAHGALLGARGNSGVILSQMLAAPPPPGGGPPPRGAPPPPPPAAPPPGGGAPAGVLRAPVAEAHASVARTPD